MWHFLYTQLPQLCQFDGPKLVYNEEQRISFIHLLSYDSLCSKQTVVLRLDNSAANSAMRAIGPGDIETSLLANGKPLLSHTRTPLTSTPTMVNLSNLEKARNVSFPLILQVLSPPPPTYALSIKLSNFLSILIVRTEPSMIKYWFFLSDRNQFAFNLDLEINQSMFMRKSNKKKFAVCFYF